ncbi:unnamed protein product [Lupinus luteus]|uniref:Uncharacterized protein n=1 Tax=Lupinus luteus TaxID=3873 RepID=A0AAV1XJH3_LUPLU
MTMLSFLPLILKNIIYLIHRIRMEQFHIGIMGYILMTEIHIIDPDSSNEESALTLYGRRPWSVLSNTPHMRGDEAGGRRSATHEGGHGFTNLRQPDLCRHSLAKAVTPFMTLAAREKCILGHDSSKGVAPPLFRSKV